MYSQKVPTYFDRLAFIRGPIPLEWVARASRGGGKGKALHLAMLIWHKCGLEKQSRTVKIGAKELRQFGIERHALYRASSKLEGLGLVAINRKAGASYTFTILDIAPRNEGGAEVKSAECSP